MPKVLTEDQVRAYERDGCLSPVREMSAARARQYREKFEALGLCESFVDGVIYNFIDQVVQSIRTS